MKSKESFNLEKFQDQFSTLISTPFAEKSGHLIPNQSRFRAGLKEMEMDTLLSLKGLETYNRNYWYKLLGNLHLTLPLVSHFMGLWKFNKLALKWFSKEFFLSRDLGEVPPTFIEEVQKEINFNYKGEKKLLLNQALGLDRAWYELFRVPFQTPIAEISIPTENSVFHLKKNIRIIFDSFGLWEKRFQIKENLENKKNYEMDQTDGIPAPSKTAQCIVLKSQNLTVDSIEISFLHGLFLEQMNHQTLANGIDRFSQTLNPEQLKLAELSIHSWIKHSLEQKLWDFVN
jgi:hypothetical protein